MKKAQFTLKRFHV